MEIARNWALAKVQETERASSVLLKDDLFQAFHSENPEISRDTLLSYFGRFMGCAPFKSVIPHKKRERYLAIVTCLLKIMKPVSWWFRKKRGHQNMINVCLMMKYQLKAKKKWENSKQQIEGKLPWVLLMYLNMMSQVRKVLLSWKTKIKVTVNTLVPKHGGMVLKILICGKKLYKRIKTF